MESDLHPKFGDEDALPARLERPSGEEDRRGLAGRYVDGG
jgi:hypothetical protein